MAAVLLFDATTGKQLERTVAHSQEIVEIGLQQARLAPFLSLMYLLFCPLSLALTRRLG
jgi:hypothetical protein